MTRNSTKELKFKRTTIPDELGTATLEDTMGSSSGQADRAVEAGGWAGTDDATSTAPSDQLGNPPLSEEEKPFHTIMRDFDESLQLDEERQEEAAEDAEDATEMLLLAEKRERPGVAAAQKINTVEKTSHK